NTVGIGSKLGVVGETRASSAVMIRRSFRSVILRGDLVKVPGAERTRRLAYGQIEMSVAREIESRSDTIEGGCEVEPSLGIGSEITVGIDDIRANLAGRSIEGRRIPVESIVRSYAGGVSVNVVNLDGMVDALHHEAIARAESLIRWFFGKCIAAVGE